MQLAQTLIKRANCPTNCPTVKTVRHTITYKVKIKDDYIREDGTSSIYIQCFVRGQQVRIPTQISCKPKDFDKQRGKIKGRTQKIKDENLIIDDFKKRIHEVQVQMRLGNTNINKDNFIDYVTKLSHQDDFIAYIKWKVGNRKEITYGTWKHHKSVAKILEQFQAYIPFTDINDDFIYKFMDYLKKVKKNSISSVYAKTKVLKTYLNLAQDDGFLFEMPKKSLKGKTFKTDINYLTYQDLSDAMNLYRENYLPESLQQTLRIFLFSCFTGLRYSDVQRLSNKNIIGAYLVITPQKTQSSGKITRIKLPKPAKELLTMSEYRPLGKVISNQKTNQNLKIITKFLKLPFPLHYHISRHTFATVFLEKGGDLKSLQELLNHASLSETEKYAHAIDKKKDRDMSNFDGI